MQPKNRFITCEICGDRSSRKNQEKRKFMAKFPLDVDRCKQWVKYVGKEDLIYVPIEKLHTLKYVCGSHFEKRSFNKKQSRLKRHAVPTKNLKFDPLPDEMLLEFPYHIHPNIEITIEKYVSRKLCDNGSSNSVKPIVQESSSPRPIDQPSSSTQRQTSLTASVAAPESIEKADTNEATKSPTIFDEPDEEYDTENVIPVSKTYTRQKQNESEFIEPEESIVPVAKTYTWEKQSEAVCITTDDVADMTQDLTMYCDDEEPPSPPPDVIGNIKQPDNTLHEGYHCDVCKSEIRGFRYTCVQCSDLDLCSACENNKAHHHHYVLRVPEPRPYAEVQSVLARIRSHLMHKLDPIKQTEEDNDDAVSIKSEVKSESEDDEDNDETRSQDSSHSTVESTTQKQKDHDDEDSAYNIERLDPEDSTEPIDSIDISSDEDTQSNAEDEENTQSMETDSLSSTARQQPTSKHKVLPSTIRKKIIGNLKDFIRTRQTPLSGKRIRVLPVLKKSNVSIPKEIAHKFEFKPQKKVMVVKLPPQGAVLNDNLRVVVQRLPLSEETRHNADIDNR